MECTKRTARLRPSSPLKRSRSAGGINITSPSSSHSPPERPVVALMAPRVVLGTSQGGGIRVRALWVTSPDNHHQQLLLGACSAARDLKKTQEKRDQAARTIRQEREGLRRAYCQDNPICCRRIGAIVLSNFVLNSHDRIPPLHALAGEYRQWFPARWLDITIPLLPITEILPAP
ncbi:hypothetical protein LIER_28025 [Lithospermum erythrorhizon]|uniref:Uncharacterized protein n=1 Tax=Lithospermum erythrorhizon TaxID=34254 RepID=A0AAV3RE42_LITER